MEDKKDPEVTLISSDSKELKVPLSIARFSKLLAVACENDSTPSPILLSVPWKNLEQIFTLMSHEPLIRRTLCESLEFSELLSLIKYSCYLDSSLLDYCCSVLIEKYIQWKLPGELETLFPTGSLPNDVTFQIHSLLPVCVNCLKSSNLCGPCTMCDRNICLFCVHDIGVFYEGRVLCCEKCSTRFRKNNFRFLPQQPRIIKYMLGKFSVHHCILPQNIDREVCDSKGQVSRKWRVVVDEETFTFSSVQSVSEKDRDICWHLRSHVFQDLLIEKVTADLAEQEKIWKQGFTGSLLTKCGCNFEFIKDIHFNTEMVEKYRNEIFSKFQKQMGI